MKLVAFMGSPRKNGNTSKITHEVIKGAESVGIETEIYNLNQLNIKGCQGCMYCRTHDLCVLKDDMEKIYASIKEADVLVIASPIYMWQVTGQVKIFLDRLFAILSTNGDNYEHYGSKVGNKQVIMIYTQGQPAEQVFQNYIEYNQNMLHLFKWDIISNIVSGGNSSPSDILKDTKNMKLAFDLGVSLINKK
ncbi:flavodoxin family protein [Cetobacterium sp.]|uniref:flavodoxin family protein n=2 Tax=Cetobacterium sp. TaxID=2071632 RepID=UPI003EE54E65